MCAQYKESTSLGLSSIPFRVGVPFKEDFPRSRDSGDFV